MAQAIVFFDIAGPDDKALRNFYCSVFGWEFDQAGQFGVPVTGPIKGTIRKDPAEQRIYVGFPDVSATLSLIGQSGGTVDVSRFEVPALLYLVFFETLLVTQWGSLRWTETVSVSRNKRLYGSKTDIK